MRKCIRLLAFAAMALTLPGAAPAPPRLQVLVNRAPPGSRLLLPAGLYLGPVVIKKPLILEGRGRPLLESGSSSRPLLAVMGDNVRISGLTLREKDAARTALVITGSHDQVNHVRIRTRGSGIRLASGQGSRLSDIRIRPFGPSSARGDGVDLINSGRNRLSGLDISRMRWGIFVGDGFRNRILRSRVSRCTYGAHLMYSQDTTLAFSRFTRNTIGVLVMEDQGARILDNCITRQAASTDAAGLELYAAQYDLVEDNRLDRNRIGIDADNLVNDRIVRNRMIANLLGLRLVASAGTVIAGNAFVANASQAQAIGSQGTALDGNYWDDLEGLATAGKGHSLLPYRASPIFLALTRAVPAYRIFFQAPGIGLLTRLFSGDSSHWLTDPAPLMHPPGRPQPRRRSGQALKAGMFLLGAGLLPFALLRNPRREPDLPSGEKHPPVLH